MAEPLDDGPFPRHEADLRGGRSADARVPVDYRPGWTLNHIYFTSRLDGGVSPRRSFRARPPRVYEVEPTGPFEDDPNVTDKKFPGKPDALVPLAAPLRIIAERDDWTR